MTYVAPIPQIPAPEGISLRYTVAQDCVLLRSCFRDPSSRVAFPMETTSETEVDDAVRRWISFSRLKSSLTAVKDGAPVGIATLYLQTYKRLAHQSEFGIIVSQDMRGHGVGTFLLSSLMQCAKRLFHLELLHLQVHEGNPAIRLYERLGFREFGRQEQWLKNAEGCYVSRILMERYL